MSIFRKPATLRNLRTGQTLTVQALIDTGASHAALPLTEAQALGLQSRARRQFELADKSVVPRDLDYVEIELAGETGIVPCAFAEGVAEPLVGATTLEILQLAVDCAREELVPTTGLMRGVAVR